ncbi:MAG: molybdate ABC transporter permease subunit [Planctomycetota bacterium]
MGPVALSLVVGATATVLSLPPAVGTAWILERTSWRGRGVLHTVIIMPLVLPPVVTGYLLLELFSPRGYLGRQLESFGVPVAFHLAGAVVAAAVVGFPLFVMMISQSLKAVDPTYEMMSRSLGHGPLSTWWRVTLPLAWPGILAGSMLAFARGLGEFGATIVLAGRIRGETETIPLAVHALLEVPGGEKRIGLLISASVALSLVCVLVSRWLESLHRHRLEVDR